jgi:hypothetical protein
MTKRPKMRLVVCAFLPLLVVASCGKGSTGQNSAATGAPPAEGVSEDEAAVWAAPQFTRPIMLHISADAYQESQQLAALNGNDPHETYGAAYETSRFFPCATNSLDAESIIHASIDGLDINQTALANALIRGNLYHFDTYTIQYPNRTTNDYGTSNVFSCVVRVDEARDYLLPADRGQNIHGPVSLLFSRRLFSAWTYRNRYETQVPGRGSVKVFAGTMIYKMDVVIPIGSYNGDGTASVRVTLNPDTGKWEVESFELHDPELVLK